MSSEAIRGKTIAQRNTTYQHYGHTFGILADAPINLEADRRPGGQSNEQEIKFYSILM